MQIACAGPTIAPAEVCGANAAIVHAEGRRLVWCNEVWYLPTGYDVARGVLCCVMDRDDR